MTSTEAGSTVGQRPSKTSKVFVRVLQTVSIEHCTAKLQQCSAVLQPFFAKWTRVSIENAMLHLGAGAVQQCGTMALLR